MSAAHDPVARDWRDLPVTAGAPDPGAPAESALDTLESLTVPAPAAPMLAGSVSIPLLPEVTVPDLLDSAAPARGRAPRPPGAAREPGRRVWAEVGWRPLVAVLAVQTALSLRLVSSNTAFQDEGLYLRAGHLEWARWLHGTPIPDFPSYFSGAPVIYPPVAALADSIGGLAAARILSLCFMLGATTLLWAATARLYGRRAALLAAALFATLAGTQFLGAFATYDAMALFLLALAAWLGIRSAGCPFRARIALLIAAGLTLAVADAVKYATALFTPVVLVVVALAVWQRRGAAHGCRLGLPWHARGSS